MRRSIRTAALAAACVFGLPAAHAHHSFAVHFLPGEIVTIIWNVRFGADPADAALVDELPEGTVVIDDAAKFEGLAAQYMAWERDPGNYLLPYDCDPSFGE